MDLFIQICVAVIAVAFIILMYSVIQTMKVLKATLDEVRMTVGQLRTDVSQITVDVKEMIHNTNAMTLDVRGKLSALDVVFTTVNDIGQALHSFTGVVKQSAASVVSSIKAEDRPAAPAVLESSRDRQDSSHHIASAVIDGVSSSLRIWNKIKKI
ncbi:DUF948 domain-containing protein [Paenibacillus gorillae]|uniref:DUF948 domain-containing protein n=1 Tax=Paenibacillus gorillae TaxID=1243662 RepID=UPI0004B48AFB|nr:DUF948 domain-containing protein [Paenibacillus gorillae]